MVAMAAACFSLGTRLAATIEPRLSAIQDRILTPNCATTACHSSGNAVNAGQLDLSSGHAYEALECLDRDAKQLPLWDRLRRGDLIVNPGVGRLSPATPLERRHTP